MNTQKLLRRGFTLEYITFGWNIVGCLVLAKAAYDARSVALLGFGIDSAIEIFASVIVVWQLKAVHKNNEKKALRCIGTAFLLLAVYLIAQSSVALLSGIHAKESILGIIWLVITSITMFLLAYGKKSIGKELQHAVLTTEAKVTLVDGILASVVLLSLLLNLFFGIWWIDAVAGFVIALYSIKEGLHAWMEM